MAKLHNFGFPRMGRQCELKSLVKQYWAQELSEEELQFESETLWMKNLHTQAKLDWVPVGDFSLYDDVLDTSFLFGNVPERTARAGHSFLQKYFALARGQSNDSALGSNYAGEKARWFDTHYHYIVPELDRNTVFSLNSKALLEKVIRARRQRFNVKPVLVGPLTYMYLAKSIDNIDKLTLLPALVEQYVRLADKLAGAGVEWLQLDEPVLSTTINDAWQTAFMSTYARLAAVPLKLLVANYFGPLRDNFAVFAGLPVAGLHVDALASRREAQTLFASLKDTQILSLGVINGRNIWRQDLQALARWLRPFQDKLKNRLWLAPSCSLLHVPVNVKIEQPAALSSGLAFAVQKLDELIALRDALNAAVPPRRPEDGSNRP